MQATTTIIRRSKWEDDDDTLVIDMDEFMARRAQQLAVDDTMVDASPAGPPPLPSRRMRVRSERTIEELRRRLERAEFDLARERETVARLRRKVARFER